jgi:hypothetical protein
MMRKQKVQNGSVLEESIPAEKLYSSSGVKTRVGRTIVTIISPIGARILGTMPV